MSVTLTAFNTMMRSFLTELVNVFPEEKQLETYLNGFDELVKINARKPLDLFINAMGPHIELVMAKDERLFEKDLGFMGELQIQKLWAQEDLSQNTRDAIFKYLSTLCILSATINSLPPELLSTIETVAEDCASKIKQGGSADIASMTSMLMKNMGGLLSDGAFSSGFDTTTTNEK
jgi:hypothetical protein